MISKVSRFLFCLLVLGFTVHVSGVLFILDGSKSTTISNLTLFLPALIMLLLDRQARKYIFYPRYAPVLVMLGFSCLIALWNEQSVTSGFDLFKVSLYIVLYLGAISWMVERDVMEKVLNLLFVIAAFFAFCSVAWHLVMVDSGYLLSGNRLSKLGYGGYADFQNPITASLYFGLFGVYGFHQLLTKRYSVAVTSVFCFCFFSLTLYVYCTLSRGVWLGYAIAIITTVILHHDARSRRWLVLAAGISLVGVVALSPVLLEQKDRGLSLRDLIWGDWLLRMPDFWLFGAGAGRAFDVCIEKGLCFSQAHNLYLQFFYEYGIGGAALLLVVVGVALRRSLDRSLWGRPLATAGLPLLVFGLVTALFDYHTMMNRPGVYWLVFWMPIALILAQQPRKELRASAGVGHDGSA